MTVKFFKSPGSLGPLFFWGHDCNLCDKRRPGLRQVIQIKHLTQDVTQDIYGPDLSSGKVGPVEGDNELSDVIDYIRGIE